MINNAPSEKPGLKAWLLLILLSLMWGSSFILIKAGLRVFDPLEVGSLRIAAAGVFLLPWAFKDIRKVNQREWKYLLYIGLMGSLIPAFLFAKAQTRIDSSLAGVINALTPLFVLFIGAIFFARKIRRNQYIGLIIGFCGTALLVMAGSGGSWDQLNFYGLFVVAATICYGFNLNIIKYKIENLKAISITSISISLVLIPATLFLLFGTDFISKMTTIPDASLAFAAITLLGIMSTSIALVIFNGLVRMTNPIFTSSVTYLIPLVAVGWGVWDGEVLLIGHFLGMIIVLAGVFIANAKK
jgi:drug/metabolite transporter (DMT)-like permease